MRLALTVSISVTLLAALALGLTVAFRAQVGLELLPLGEDEEPPVVILVLGRRAHVDAVREAAAAGGGLLYTDEDAFALAGGRIVASGVEAAAAPLNALGWQDRELEILDPTNFQRGARRRASQGSGGALTLAELARKPTLTPGEALRALNLMR